MYLFLGEADDGLCVNVRQALEERGAQVRVVPDPFSESIRFAWRVNSASTSSALVFADGTCLCDRDISGVFLRRRKALITSTSSDDYCYIQAEIEAASLGWIWTLQCPVINRLPLGFGIVGNLPFKSGAACFGLTGYKSSNAAGRAAALNLRIGMTSGRSTSAIRTFVTFAPV
jgi:hypothetical protein